MKCQKFFVLVIIVFLLPVFNGSAQTYLARSISQETDDAGIVHYNCSFSTSNNEIYFGECDNGSDMVGGFRFTDVGFESSAEVSNVRLEFWVDGTYTTPLELRIYGEAADNPATFSFGSKPSDRTRTTSYVDWVLTEENVWQWNTKRSTPDLSPILEEILDRPGWQSGNAVVFLVTNVESNNQHRRVYAFEREGMQKAAKLIVNENSGVVEPYDIYQRVLLINLDPIIPSHNNARLHDVLNWNDPLPLSDQYAADMEEVSHNLVDYDISQVIHGNYFPVKESGYRFSTGSEETFGSFLYSWKYNNWTDNSMVDYRAIVRDYDMARKVDFGEIDEFWVFGGPYFGFYESRMAGKGAYWCNSPELTRVPCSKIFVQMGFSYERGVAEMLHDNGHRTESIMKFVYGSWSNDSTHAWNRFTLYDKIHPGGAACGNVHFPPNGVSDYDYGNSNYVWSTHNDWLNNYPNLTGEKELINSDAWSSDMRLYHKWWFERIPHVSGSLSEYGMNRLNNWWPYIYDFNRFPESGSTLAQGAFSGEPSTFFADQLTNDQNDDWRPVVNNLGRVVWHGFDGHDFEIYSALLDGRDRVQITNNDIDDEYPQINDAGYVVWQAFDGVDYEIFTANERGENIRQITDNDQNDWHVQMNENGRLVWDFWDGVDYEIISCDIDGTNRAQITNNDAGSAYPLDDVWPQINNTGRVVWMGYNESYWHIFSANSDGSDLTRLSSSYRDHQYPQINDLGEVVWFAYHNDVNTEIYAALSDGSASERQISDNAYEDWYPYINNEGTIVWMGHDGTSWDVYTAQFDGSSLTNISNGMTDHTHPRIDDDGFIAWQGYDGHDWEIFGWKGGKLYQLSNNDFDDLAAFVRNEQVVWHGKTSGFGSSEIFSSYSSAPVGVELVSFTAKKTGNEIVLEWTTATETINIGFEVQKKLSAHESFTRIGFVQGNGTTTVPHTYSFTDSAGARGRCYYRLKQLDADGAFNYSEIAQVAGPPLRFALMQNYPNPFNSSTRFAIEIPSDEKLDFEICDLLGRPVKILFEGMITEGQHVFNWDGTNENHFPASSGTYFAVLKNGSNQAVRKIILLR